MAVSPPSPAVTRAIADLATLARLLATTALDAARSRGGDAKDIARAQAALANADTLRAQGLFDDAINEYKVAWRWADKAMPKTSKH